MLCHQLGEVQDIADFVGDPLELSQNAAKTNADVIVFCGVHFMAETASILSPDKTVLLPDMNAGCPMANMATASELREKKREHPGAVVVVHPECRAEVIALEKILWALEEMSPQVKVPKDIRLRGKGAVDRMLRIV